MEKLSMCRICLVEGVKMYSLINVNLQELYERLTDMPFMTMTKKPVQVCYLCCARLQNCHRLRAICLKSEEFFNEVMANNELKQMESQDLNTLNTVHPLIHISCVPSMRKDTDDDDKIYENNEVKFDPSAITPDAQVKYEDDSFINEAVDIKSEITVKDEDFYTEDGDMSDNSHTMQDIQLEHDIQLKPVKIALKRIDLEQFEIGSSAAENSKMDLLNGNTGSTISIDIPESEVTVLQNNNFEKKIHTIGKAFIVENKNIVKQMSFIDKYIKKNKINTCNDVRSKNNLTHKHNLKSRTQHVDENLYRCDVCEKSFTVQARLVAHIRIHTGERPYTCTTCNRSFTRKGHLKTHTQIHTGERPYRCITCNYSFTRKGHLVRHTRVHTGEGPYTCNICEKSLTTKISLVRHKRLHTVERPYRCITCNQSFIRKDHLIRHIRIHTGERSYTCNVCGKSFNRKSNLVTHIRIHTG